MSQNNVLPEERTALLKQLIKEQVVTVATLDIETCPIPAWVWGAGEQIIGYEQIEDEFYTANGKPISGETKLIMAQYIIEGQEKPKVIEWDENHNDLHILQDLYNEVFLQPNLILVGQNQKDFDMKIINDRSVKHDMEPISFNKIIQIDVLKLSRGSFRRLSHKLDYRSKRYGLGGKLKMEFKDWIDTVKYDGKAQQKMVKYGLKDPKDTIEVFWKELPYYQTLPAKLESLLREARDRNKLICYHCEERKQKKFDVIKINKRTAKCNQCGIEWEV